MEKESTTNVPGKALLLARKTPLTCGLRSLPLLFVLPSSSSENRPRSIYLPAFFSHVSIFPHKPSPAPLCIIPPMRHPPNHHHGQPCFFATRPCSRFFFFPKRGLLPLLQNARKKKENNSPGPSPQRGLQYDII